MATAPVSTFVVQSHGLSGPNQVGVTLTQVVPNDDGDLVAGAPAGTSAAGYTFYVPVEEAHNYPVGSHFEMALTPLKKKAATT